MTKSKNRKQRNSKSNFSVISHKRSLNYWVSIFAIVAGVAAVIGLFPTLYDFYEKIMSNMLFQSKLLSIDEYYISLGENTQLVIPLLEGQDPRNIDFKINNDLKKNFNTYGRKCLGNQKKCEVYILPEKLSDEQGLFLKISSKAIGSPSLVIQGIDIKLLDYEPIDSKPVEAIHLPGRGGGGGGWSYFDLKDFPHVLK